MTDTPSRMFGLLLVLVGVWVVTYWLYEPMRPRVTADDRRDPLATVQTAQRPVIPNADPPSSRPDLVPLPSQNDPKPAPQPPAPSAPARRVQKVVPPEFREYLVQKGDVSWESIAARKEVYGDRKLWQAVSRANPFATPDRLYVGKTKLKIAVDPENIQGKTIWVDEATGQVNPNPGETAHASEPAKTAAKPEGITYTIVADDTLWGISKKMYGQGANWRRIYEANKDVIKDPDRPPTGAVLRIPPPKD